jgi:ornithine decarboxylase
MTWYYIDDGVYGSFSGQIFDHVRYPLEVFAASGPARPSVLAGPTCDSIDVVAEDLPLPDLPLGTIIVGHMMGAYSAATATEFNSLQKARMMVLNRQSAFGVGLPEPEHFISAVSLRSLKAPGVVH